MAEVRLNIDEQFIDDLKSDTGVKKTSQIANDALVLLRWLVSESQKGRILISTNKDGKDAKEIVMPILENAKRREQQLHLSENEE